MRRIAGVLFAVAMVAPIGLVASPAGAAAGATCKTISGTAAFSPGLPPVTAKTTAKPTVTIKNAKLGGCTGGVTSGTLSATLKFGIANNCKTLIAGATTNTSGTATVVWNNKTTSTIALKLVGVKGKPTQTTIPGTVTTGAFKGSKSSGTVVYTIAGGQCTSKPLTSVPFKQVTSIVI